MKVTIPKTLQAQSAELHTIIRFAAKMVDLDTRNLRVSVKRWGRKDWPGRGWAYPYRACFGERGYLVTIKLALDASFPCKDQSKSNPPTWQNWQEFAVWLAAHELRHIRDFQMGAVTGITPSEYPANKSAGIALMEWRKQNGQSTPV